MLEDVAPPRERSGTSTTSMAPGSRQILAVCSSLALAVYVDIGSKQRGWVINTGVGFETSVLIVHTGVQLKT